MDRTIKKLLKNNSVDSVLHTHVSLINPKGKYQFNRETLEEFWHAYCTLIDESEDPVVGIAEKPQQYLPILVDVDLRIREKDGVVDSLYTEEQLETVIKVYQKVIKQIVDQCKDDDLICVALEKKMYQQEKNEVVYFKHGFHLHFPNIFLNKVDQEVQLIPRVQEEIKTLQLFSNLEVEDSGTVIDKVCCKVPWLLYGSRKSETAEPYRVTKVYDSNLRKITLEKAFKNYQIFNHKEHLIPIQGKVKFYLPRILSILPYGRVAKGIKHGIISPLKEKMKKDTKRPQTTTTRFTVEESLSIAKKLLPMLSQYRVEDRNEWMTIGWCLYNISEGQPEGLELWCEFSSRSEDKYDENVCIYQWDRMTKRDLTVGTLKYYASVDNPAEYKKYKQEQTKKYIIESLNGSHNDIAKALYAEYGDEFVCASIANKIWFQFNNHKWETIEEGVFLRQKISAEIVYKYIDIGKNLYDEMRNAQDKTTQQMCDAKIKALNKMVSNLKSAPFKNNVMKECMEVFYDPRFREKLDSDPYLIAFKNGVYDLRLNVFRSGRPEDFLSKNMPIDYISFNRDDEKVHSVYTFLEQVFPDKDIRNYFLDVSSDIFVGGNHEKIVLFWTGEGDNGKSITQKFFELMMGNHLSIKLNTNVITGKKPSAGSAFADLARAGGGVRWAVLEEPDSDEVINTGIFKHLSGNDSFYARDLFERGKDGREISPMFKLVFICLAGDTRVSLPSGVSLSIKNMHENRDLLGYSEETDSLISICQYRLLDQSSQQCLQLVLQDGRTIECTPNHKFLTANNVWIEASNITSETILKMGPDYALCDDMIDDYEPFYGYGLQTFTDKLKGMALFRLFGYLITENNNPDKIITNNYLDAEDIRRDIELVTGDDIYINQLQTIYEIKLPEKLIKHIEDTNILQLVIDETCPLFLLREFLGAFYGRHSIPLHYHRYRHRALSVMSRDTLLLHVINKVLLRFGINSIVSKPIMNLYSMSLRILQNNILSFTEKIGIRYSQRKNCRLTGVSTMLRFKKAVDLQNERILSKTNQLHETGMKWESAFYQALQEQEYIIHPKYTLDYSNARLRLLNQNNASINWVDFVDETKLSNYFSTTINSESIPCYQLRVIHKKEIGLRKVYDIVAEEPFSNFIANGIVTHNCNKLPRIKAADKAVWNRVRVIPFESTFCRVDSANPPPETYAEQLRQKRFPMDKQFSKKIPDLVEAFAAVLLQHRIDIAGKPRVEPEKVRAATEVYRRQNDIYRQFIEEVIIEDSTQSIALSSLYNLFKEWFKESLPGHSLPVKNEIEEYFCKIWGPPESKKWKGYRQKTIHDEVAKGEAVILSEDDIVVYQDNEQ